jgi:hypothetical protein
MDEAERIIRVLIVKDEQAVKDIGDPSVFMGVFDIDEEVRITAEVIEKGKSAEDFDAMLNPEHNADDDFDFFALLDGETEISQESEVATQIEEIPRLFADDFSYTLESLKVFNQTLPLQYQVIESQSLIELTFPSDLKRRYQRLPKEIQPAPTEPLRLCADKELVKKDLEESRKAEERWTPVQYLWELHPAVQWLNDLNLTAFGRHQAPVLTIPLLPEAEVVFVMTGLIPNRRGQPLLNEWFSVVFSASKFSHIETFADTLKRTGLGKKSIPNRIVPIEEQLFDLRNEAVDIARREMLTKQKDFETRINQELQEQCDRLDQLRKEHNQQLEIKFADGSPLVKERKQREQNQIERIFDDYLQWVEDSMTAEPEPYIKIIAVFQGDKV